MSADLAREYRVIRPETIKPKMVAGVDTIHGVTLMGVGQASVFATPYDNHHPIRPAQGLFAHLGDPEKIATLAKNYGVRPIAALCEGDYVRTPIFKGLPNPQAMVQMVSEVMRAVEPGDHNRIAFGPYVRIGRGDKVELTPDRFCVWIALSEPESIHQPGYVASYTPSLREVYGI